MRGPFKYLSFSLFPLLCLVLLSGCLGNRSWEYPPAASGSYIEEKASKPISGKAIVLPLEDLRGNAVKEEYWMAAIPLVPYGDTQYERPEIAEKPEKVDVVNFDPPNDFARAIADELNQAGIYSSVTFAENDRQHQADVVFRGRLRSTNWNRRLYTYLLGPVGAVFWLVGAPMSETTTDLQFDLRLTPVDNPDKVLWNMTMDFKGAQFDSPYYNLATPVESYPQAIQEAMKPAIADLVNLTEQDPERLLP